MVQKRDRRLLAALEQLVVVDRSQAQVLAPFHSVARANARLLALTRAGMLRRSFISAGDFGHKAVYRLPRVSGGRLIETRINHQLALNRVYLWLRDQPHDAPLRLAHFRACTKPVAGLRLIPDAYAELATPGGQLSAFIEADCGTEPLSVWRKKAEGYVALATSGAFAAEFGRDRFRVLVVASSLRRAHTISSAVAGVTIKLFWFTDFESINQADAGAAIWLRPGSDAPVSLLPLCATVGPAAGSAQASPVSAQPAAEAMM